MKNLFHGVVLEFGSGAILFTGRPGIGKSTQAKLWMERFGEEAVVISGDAPLLWFDENERLMAKGLPKPYCGKEGWWADKETEVNAVILLEQSCKDEIVRISASECLNDLVLQAYSKTKCNKDETRALLAFMGRLLRKPIYRLKCTPTQNAVECTIAKLKADGLL